MSTGQSSFHRCAYRGTKAPISVDNKGMSNTQLASQHYDDMMSDMRTTIDIEDRALTIIRGYATAEHCSLGQAVSRLIMRQEAPGVAPEGFPVFPGVPEHTITNELIARYRDDDAE